MGKGHDIHGDDIMKCVLALLVGALIDQMIGQSSIAGPFVVFFITLISLWLALRTIQLLKIATFVSILGISLIAAMAYWTYWSEPKLQAQEVKDARATLLSNTDQCSDLGRGEAVRVLLENGENLWRLNLDCIKFNNLTLPSGASIPSALFSRIQAIDGKFKGVDLTGAVLSGSILHKAKFNDADLRGAVFGVAVVNTKDGPQCVRAAEMKGADLTGADLNGTHFIGVKDLKCKQLRAGRRWEKSHRGPELKCEGDLPKPHDYMVGWLRQCSGRKAGDTR
jgi:hypothetical protein